MIEQYRKWGRAIRFEHGKLVEITEAGEAIQTPESFETHPLDDRTRIPDLDGSGVEHFATELRKLVRRPLSLERLLVIDGAAEHQFGDTVWRDGIRLVHLSVSRGRDRLLIDRGSFELAEVEAAVEAFSRLSARDRPAPPVIQIAEAVGASLAQVLLRTPLDGAVVWQRGGAIDGKGQLVQEGPASIADAPNWYRPSYRTRPLRAPLHLELRSASQPAVVPVDAPTAIALLAPPAGLRCRVLLTDGRMSRSADVEISRILKIEPPGSYYPYGTGAYGSRLTVALK